MTLKRDVDHLPDGRACVYFTARLVVGRYARGERAARATRRRRRQWRHWRPHVAFRGAQRQETPAGHLLTLILK